jgi:hypothetical protein
MERLSRRIVACWIATDIVSASLFVYVQKQAQKIAP